MPDARPIAMTAAFTLQLGSPILDGLATVGKWDGRSPSLACGTTGGKVMIHNALETSGGGPVRFLNVNRQAVALAACRLTPSKPSDVLLIAAQTCLVAYNVEANSDMFFKDVTDGINAMVCGVVGSSDAPLALVGGNCSILGFDDEGNEKFWTVTGDNVSALSLMRWAAGDAQDSLIVGSDDFEVRVFSKEVLKCQFTESDKVTHFSPTQQIGRFAYGLGNGTVGMYEQQKRQWRHKNKHKLVALQCIDVDFDGIAEVVCGWSNGRYEVRSDAGARTGDVAFKDMFPSPVSAIVAADYRQEGRNIPIVCSYDGEVRGYVAVATKVEEAVATRDQQSLETVLQQLQNLQFEISNLEKQTAKRREEGHGGVSTTVDIKVQCKLRPNATGKAIDLLLCATGGPAFVHSAVVSAEAVFGSTDCIYSRAETPSDTLVCTLQLDKDMPCELKIAAMVGFRGNDVLQVHDVALRLPKFAMYVPVPMPFDEAPTGFVTFRSSERVNRIIMWAQSAFNGFQHPPEAPSMEGRFISLRDGSKLVVQAANGEIFIRCNSMDIAGDILQDLAAFLSITELSTLAEFPADYAVFQEVLTKVEEYNSVRVKLTTEMADSTQFVKSLVIKAEDARILFDMRAMKKMYSSLYEVNRGLIGEFMKRANNHNELLAALKEVNAMIQKAGKLRVGQAKTNLIAECRNAIKANANQMLFNIMRTGKP